jgi:hypothetical protein
MTVTIVLALATLGIATLIETILSVLHRPRWPRQESNDCRCYRRYRVTFANVTIHQRLRGKCFINLRPVALTHITHELHRLRVNGGPVMEQHILDTYAVKQ